MRRGNRQVWWMLNRRHRTPFRQRLLRIPVKRGGTTTRRRTSAFSRATRERPLRSFSPLLFLHFFFVIIQPSSPFFHPPPLSFAFSTTLDDASIEILLPPPPPFEWFQVLSSPFNHPTLHDGAQGGDDNHPRTSPALNDSSAELRGGSNEVG